MRYSIQTLALLFMSLSMIAQNDIDRYFKAWAYLETAELDLAYRWSSTAKVKKKDKSQKLHVVETIQFQGIGIFDRVIEKNLKETCAFDSSLCLTSEIYRDRFNFTPFLVEEFKVPFDSIG